MTASIRRRASVGASGQLLLERSLVVELHQRLDARAQGRPAARHRRGLDRLEQLTLGRAVLDGPAHVRHDAVLPSAVRENSDDDHLAILDRELLALADRHGAQRPASPDVVGIFLRHPVPERIAVGAGGPSIDLVAHRDLHVDSRRAEGITLLPRRFLHTLASMASAPPTAAPPTSTSRIPGLARSWIDRNFLALGREMRLSYLPPLMVYVAAGIAGLTSIVAVFYIKVRLGLSAEFLAGLGFWAGLPWALKVPLGHLVDLIWRWKGALVFVGAAMIAASIGIMVGLLGYTDSMRALASVEAWFVFSTLLAPIGYVVQDVVADAMTVEAVPRFDAEGRPTSMAERKSMNTTVQTLGRVAIIGGSVLVSLANVYLLRGAGALPEAERTLAYLRVYELALVIPFVSVLGVVFGMALARRAPPGQLVDPRRRPRVRGRLARRRRRAGRRRSGDRVRCVDGHRAVPDPAAHRRAGGGCASCAGGDRAGRLRVPGHAGPGRRLDVVDDRSTRLRSTVPRHAVADRQRAHPRRTVHLSPLHGRTLDRLHRRLPHHREHGARPSRRRHVLRAPRMDGGAHRWSGRCAHDRAHRHGARITARPDRDGADAGVDREFRARPLESDVLRDHGVVHEPRAGGGAARNEVPESDLHRCPRSEGRHRRAHVAVRLQRTRDAAGGDDRAQFRAADAGDPVRQVEPFPQRLRSRIEETEYPQAAKP